MTIIPFFDKFLLHSLINSSGLGTCAKTFKAVMTSNFFPNSIFSLAKNLLYTSMPFALAIGAIFCAGSTPVRSQSNLENFSNKVPSLHAISRILAFLPKILYIFFANDSQYSFIVREVPVT